MNAEEKLKQLDAMERELKESIAHLNATKKKVRASVATMERQGIK